jgi:exodeoxyribonuclease I
MSVSPTFFWHDYETFGRVPRRDRPAQFAGVRTDAELNEIGEPLMVYCQPPLDTLPDPESCLLTGITPQHCQRHGLPEHAFAARIAEALSQPGTVGVGYNTLRFDDEVTRHLFWRNLIDPYAREWQNGCGRWDILDLVRTAWALRPEGIEWPGHEDGRPSFKLEHLSAANGLAHEAAHDALSDVRATIGLARLIRQRQPRLYDFCLKLHRKDAVWAEIGGQIGTPQARPLLHISGMYGTERGCMAVVWPVAPHPTNRNELIVWDLAHDPQELLALDAQTMRERLYTRSDELPEGVTRLPLKTLHVNKSPVIISALKTLPAQRAQDVGLDLDQVMRHVELARAQAAALAAGPWAEVFRRPPSDAVVDVDEDLYGGFVPPGDRRQLEQLRGLDGAALAARRPAFEDGRLEELLFRYRARNWPQALGEAEQQRWQALRIERLHGGAGGGLSVSRFLERIDALSEQADERGQELLAELYDWAEAIAPELD